MPEIVEIEETEETPTEKSQEQTELEKGEEELKEPAEEAGEAEDGEQNKEPAEADEVQEPAAVLIPEKTEEELKLEEAAERAAAAIAAAEAAAAAEVAAHEEELRKDDEKVKAQLASLAEEAAAAGKVDIETKPPDPALEPPAPVRTDWEGDLSSMQGLVEDGGIDEDKVKTLHAALVQRIEDTKNLEDHKALTLRRLLEAEKERDRCKAETQRALQSKAKLEGSCRDLQEQKGTISKENRTIADEEQKRHTELKTKFEQAIKDVQEKMDAELEVRQHFLKENEELRTKLTKFTETYEAQETQLAEQRVTRESEMEVAHKRLKEHQTFCAQSKIKTAELDKHNEILRKSQVVLRAELQAIVGKFDEFHDQVTGSNTKHGESKVEIDDLQSKLQEYEKENMSLKASEELKTATEEHKVAEKQRDALEKLCDNLVRENKKLQEQLKKAKP